MPQPDINSEKYWANRRKVMRRIAESFGVNSESVVPAKVEPPTLVDKIRRNHGLTDQTKIDQNPYEMLREKLRGQNLLDR